MNNHTTMPTVTFGEDTSYDTLDALVSGWSATITLASGETLTAQWVNTDGGNNANVLAWSPERGAFITPVIVPIDTIVFVAIL